MAEKFKVYNKTKGDYGAKLVSGIEINIKPGSFALMTEDDVAYIESVTNYKKRPFATGRLVIEDNKAVEVSMATGIEPDEENHFESDEEIDKKLKGNMKAMEKWLKGIEDKPMLYNIAERAKVLDLPASKMKLIDAKVPNAGLMD